jgi:acyl-coenzyme A synthetase/AMP-(fatty) acid ligase
VRWRADGELLFLGRLDFQAKLHGYRIEPVEIETALLEHPNVRAATVVTPLSGSGESRLAAYPVLDGTRDVSRDELRRFLSDRLPGHMVPAHFIALRSLPLATGED